MTEHPNAAKMRKLAKAAIHRDFDTLMAAFSPTCTWRVPGSGSLGGVLRGHEGVQMFFNQLIERSNDTATVEVEDTLASDDHGVLFLRLTAETPDGPVDTRVAHFATINAEGKFDHNWWLASDQAQADRAMG